MDDRGVVASIAAGDEAGLAAAYGEYAASIYGYCQWLLEDPARAAEALLNTFVVASATIDRLVDDTRLRPWLYALARRQCQQLRVTKPESAGEKAETAAQAAVSGAPAEVTAPAPGPAPDATLTFRAVSLPDPGPGPAPDTTLTFRAVIPAAPAPGANLAGSAPDATLTFRAVSLPDPGPGPAPDTTLTFRAVTPPAHKADANAPAVDANAPVLSPGASLTPPDATMVFILGDHPADVTQPIAALRHAVIPIGRPPGPTEIEPSALVRAVFAGLEPAEREAVYLATWHNLYDGDLAMAMNWSWDKAHAQTAQARNRLEQTLSALLAAYSGRNACPELDTLLAGWNGQLTENAYALVNRHVGKCAVCGQPAFGALPPSALSALLPLAELPPNLRKRVLGMCFSTTRDAVRYRRQVVRRAESAWPMWFNPASRTTDPARSGKKPQLTAETISITIWILAVWGVIATLLVFTGPHSSRTLTTRPDNKHPGSEPVAAVTSAAPPRIVRTSFSAGPSPRHRPSPTRVPPSSLAPASPITETPSPSRSPRPSRSPKPSKSAKPSKSPSASPSESPSASPSGTSSASPSPT